MFSGTRIVNQSADRAESGVGRQGREVGRVVFVITFNDKQTSNVLGNVMFVSLLYAAPYVITEKFNGLFLSDHHPVEGTVKY